eukprot:1855398-Pyramimonas_sp.AAC.1
MILPQPPHQHPPRQHLSSAPIVSTYRFAPCSEITPPPPPAPTADGRVAQSACARGGRARIRFQKPERRRCFTLFY